MATIQAVAVEGVEHEMEEPGGPLEVILQNAPPEGVVIAFRTFDRQPMALDLVSVRFGLPQIDSVEIGARPSHLLRRPRWLTDSTLVRSSIWF